MDAVTVTASAAGEQQMAGMYAVLSATNEALLYATTPQELFQRVCDAAVAGRKFLTAAVTTPDADTSWMRVEAASGIAAQNLRAVRISVDAATAEGQGLVGEAYRTLTAAISNEFMLDPRTRPWHSAGQRAGVASGAAIPICRDGAALGVMLFYSAELNVFDAAIVALLQRMAVNIVFALGNFEREVERRRSEEALRESEARFRALTHLSSDWYWEQDADYRFTRLESRHADEDARPNPLIGRCVWDSRLEIQSPGGWESFREMLDARKSFRDLIMQRVAPDRSPYYVSLSGEPVFGTDGGFSGYRGISREITDQKVAEEHIQYLARHDQLTGLPNRLTFSNLLSMAIPTASRYSRNFAVLFVDLDRFKFINDTLGHQAGDLLLKEIAARFKQTLRASDVIARLGGDEFVVLIQEIADAEDAATVARKMLSAAIKPVMLMGQECRLTASIGIALFPRDGEDEQALMKNADIAMYFAKEEGKNNFQFYSKEINSQSLERLVLESHLRHAMEHNELSLHYQAKLDLQTHAITGVEALLRWNNTELGNVSPAKFIPVAEDTGLIVSIGRWVLKTACLQNMAWQSLGLPPINMAVNLSARQFADEELVQDIALTLQETGMPAELLELEITEGMIIHNVERAIKLLTEIKQMGVRLAIDDFGTGYSSLGQLKNFPIDTLKVDRSFIRDLATDPEDKAITAAIIAMGKTLSLKVVAEGVETIEQQNFLRDQSCDEMQGYYFSKPIVADEFAALLRKNTQP